MHNQVTWARRFFTLKTKIAVNICVLSPLARLKTFLKSVDIWSRYDENLVASLLDHPVWRTAVEYSYLGTSIVSEATSRLRTTIYKGHNKPNYKLRMKARIFAKTVTCLFRCRFLLLLLFLDGGAAGCDLRGVDWKRIVGRWVLFHVGYNAALVVSQLVDHSRYERPFSYILLYTASLASLSAAAAHS